MEVAANLIELSNFGDSPSDDPLPNMVWCPFVRPKNLSRSSRNSVALLTSPMADQILKKYPSFHRDSTLVTMPDVFHTSNENESFFGVFLKKSNFRVDGLKMNWTCADVNGRLIEGIYFSLFSYFFCVCSD